MKTPITYYGGKQSMLPKILPLIPVHCTYVEPFFGGGAVFWAKQPANFEVVNDLNNRLITFYKVLKYDFEDLSNKIDETFHSRFQKKESWEEYKSGADEIKNEIQMAWAVWTSLILGYGSKLGNSFGFDKKGTQPLRVFNKKAAFTQAYQQRLKKVTIESYDAIKVIQTYDSEDTFFYLDPPYVSSNQGHYAGYNLEMFTKLLDVCANMKGKFILSSYPEEILQEYRKAYNWNFQDFEMRISMTAKNDPTRMKTECLTYNF